MSGLVLILRPQPGAAVTAERAQAIGLSPVIAPLFSIRPLSWQVPDAHEYDALLLTSANAARHGGDGLRSLLDLHCYAVGGATAAAARAAGLNVAHVGTGDSAHLLRTMATHGIRSALHLCGREFRLPTCPAVDILSIPVYAADAVETLPAAAVQAIEAKAVALLHSPRAARLFADQIGPQRAGLSAAAISTAAAKAAGAGWAAIEIAAEPRDQALLEAAAKLCHTGN